MTQTASQIATQPQREPNSLMRSEESEESVSIDEVALAELIAFFRLLDKWDLEVTAVQKLCSNCSETVRYSIVVIISSIGIIRRVQQSSSAVLFCERCFRELCERQCSDKLQQAVNNAYTQLNERLRERSTA
jgi:hypothetical protein